MTEKKVLVALLKSKLDKVIEQKDELQGTFDAYIEQLKAQVEAVTETDEQQPGQLREMNSVVEAVQEYIMRLNIEIKDAAVSGSPLKAPDTLGRTAATLTSASPEDVSGSAHSLQSTKRCDDMEKKLQENESKHQQAEKANMETIETQLETFLQEKNIDHREVDWVTREVKDLLKKMNTFSDYPNFFLQPWMISDKLQDQTPAPAFTAELDRTITVKRDTYIKDLTRVSNERGDSYNPKTCLFTAPRDGVCVALGSTLQVGEGEVEVHVTQDRSGSLEALVCDISTTADEPSSCNVGVVEVKAGDTLGVKVGYVDGEPQLSSPGTSFSCFFIG